MKHALDILLSLVGGLVLLVALPFGLLGQIGERLARVGIWLVAAKR